MAQLLIPGSVDNRVWSSPEAVVEMASPAPRDIWRGVLRDDPGATAMQTPEYLEAVVEATGGPTSAASTSCATAVSSSCRWSAGRPGLGVHLDGGYPEGYGRGGMLATGGLLADDVRVVVQDLRGQSLSSWIGGAHHTDEQWSAGLLPGVVEERSSVSVIELGPGCTDYPEAFRTAQFGESHPAAAPPRRSDGRRGRARHHRTAGPGLP